MNSEEMNSYREVEKLRREPQSIVNICFSLRPSAHSPRNSAVK
jgi:hypothetical protein